MGKKNKSYQKKKENRESVPLSDSLPVSFSEMGEEDSNIFQDFSARVSPFIISKGFQSGSGGHSVSFPALSIMPPQVLFYSSDECVRQCRGGRKMTEYEKTLHRKVNILMMTLFSRSSFMSTRWAPFLPDGGFKKKDINFDIPSPLTHSHHHPSCPCNTGSNGGFGARLYSHMLHMKNRLMTCPQYIADGDSKKSYDERLAGYWAGLDSQTRVSLVLEEMDQLKSLIFLDGRSNSSNSKSPPTFPTSMFLLYVLIQKGWYQGFG